MQAGQPAQDIRFAIDDADLRKFSATVDRLSEIAVAEYGRHRRPKLVRSKKDGSLVTELDTEIENRWREEILNTYPDHRIVGEEFPAVPGESDFCWILDPLDGTDDYVRGIPQFASCMALSYRELPIVSAIVHPALGLCLSATFGEGVNVLRDRSDCDPMPATQSGDHICIALPTLGDSLRFDPTESTYRELVRRFKNYRVYRNAYAHTAVLTGALDAAIEFDVAVWDVAATQLLIEEKGLTFTVLAKRTDNCGVTRLSVVFGRELVVGRLLDAVGNMNPLS